MQIRTEKRCGIASLVRRSGAEGEPWINNFPPSPHTENICQAHITVVHAALSARIKVISWRGLH